MYSYERCRRCCWLPACVRDPAAGNAPRVEASSKQDRQAGAALFHEKGCEHCHGVDGVGTDRAPSLTTVGKRRKKAQIVQQIEQGGKGMPAYGDVLKPDEISG